MDKLWYLTLSCGVIPLSQKLELANKMGCFTEFGILCLIYLVMSMWACRTFVLATSKEKRKSRVRMACRKGMDYEDGRNFEYNLMLVFCW